MKPVFTSAIYRLFESFISNPSSYAEYKCINWHLYSECTTVRTGTSEMDSKYSNDRINQRIATLFSFKFIIGIDTYSL